MQLEFASSSTADELDQWRPNDQLRMMSTPIVYMYMYVPSLEKTGHMYIQIDQCGCPLHILWHPDWQKNAKASAFSYLNLNIEVLKKPTNHTTSMQRQMGWLSISLFSLIMHLAAARDVCGQLLDVDSTLIDNLNLRIDCRDRTRIRYMKLEMITQNLDLKVDDAVADSVIFDELVTVHGDINIEVLDESGLMDLLFPKLTTIYGDLTLRLKSESYIPTLLFPKLQRIHGDLKLDVRKSSTLGYLDFPQLQQLSLVEIKISSSSVLNSLVLGRESNSK